MLTTLGYSATPAGVCAVDPSTGALTLVGAGDCEITATAAGSSDYNEATATFTVTVRPAGALVLNLGVIAVTTPSASPRRPPDSPSAATPGPRSAWR